MTAEQQMIQLLAPDDKDTNNRQFTNRGYDSLTVMQKLEVFRGCLKSTKGDEIASMIWLRSPDAETWIDRRSNFVNTLATMCMAGYILGLGDRHPSNLMIQQLTGKVVHIDFGDCFEIAMQREHFPELVPFRLTRLLVRAIEVLTISLRCRSLYSCSSVVPAVPLPM
jgi:FKBP12-rapamycin complex-associated protein